MKLDLEECQVESKERTWHVGDIYKKNCMARKIRYRYFGTLEGKRMMGLFAAATGYTIVWE